MTIRIIGGGIVGLSVAYHLSQTNEDITVFEIDKSYERASFARSCGGMRSQFSTPANIAMSRHSIDFIQNQTDVEFTPNGYLLLFDASRAEDHDHSLALQQETGASTRSLAPEALQALYPELNTEGLYRGCLTQDGTEGWIDPIALHHWYRDQCLRAGVNIVYDDHRQYPSHASDITVICAGYGTRDVARHFGIETPCKARSIRFFRSAPSARSAPGYLWSPILLRASTSGLKARATSPATRGITKAKSMTWSPLGAAGMNYGSDFITASPAFLTEQR